MADGESAGLLDFDSPYFFGEGGSTTFWFMWAVLCIVPVLYTLMTAKVDPPGGDSWGEETLPRPASEGHIQINANTTKGPRKQTIMRHAAAPEGPETSGAAIGGEPQYGADGELLAPLNANNKVRTKSNRQMTPRAADVRERAGSGGSGGSATFHFSNVSMDQ